MGAFRAPLALTPGATPQCQGPPGPQRYNSPIFCDCTYCEWQNFEDYGSFKNSCFVSRLRLTKLRRLRKVSSSYALTFILEELGTGTPPRNRNSQNQIVHFFGTEREARHDKLPLRCFDTQEPRELRLVRLFARRHHAHIMAANTTPKRQARRELFASRNFLSQRDP